MSDVRSAHDREPDEGAEVDEPAVLSRRTLLARGGAALGGVAVAGAAAPAMAAARSTEAADAKKKKKKEKHGYSLRGTWAEAPRFPFRVFSGYDIDVVGAMANRIYPSDALGPGATDLGVVEYIDGQLAEGWGTGERMYRQGPFEIPKTSGHGWQYAMTPAGAYRVALDSLNAYTKAKFRGRTFDELTTKQQDKILTDLSTGTKELDAYFDQIAAPDFFALFYENVKEGIFADPSYGGNHGVEGWKLIRYPGDPMARGDDNWKYVLDYNYYPPGPPRPMQAGV